LKDCITKGWTSHVTPVLIGTPNDPHANTDTNAAIHPHESVQESNTDTVPAGATAAAAESDSIAVTDAAGTASSGILLEEFVYLFRLRLFQQDVRVDLCRLLCPLFTFCALARNHRRGFVWLQSPVRLSVQDDRRRRRREKRSRRRGAQKKNQLFFRRLCCQEHGRQSNQTTTKCSTVDCIDQSSARTKDGKWLVVDCCRLTTSSIAVVRARQ